MKDKGGWEDRNRQRCGADPSDPCKRKGEGKKTG